MQGHIHKRVRQDKHGKDRTLWYVVVDAGLGADGRRQQKWHGSFRTRRDAEVARAKIVDDVHSGAYVAPGKVTFSEWVIDSWLPTMATRVKPSTLHSYRRNLEIHVLPALGGIKLQQITPVMLNKLYATLASPTPERDGLSPKSIRYIHTTIHKALTDAADADLLQRNPAERAKPPRVNGGATAGVASWDTDELSAFLGAVADLRLGPIWRLAAMTGMRRGEILGLRWTDVDLDAARLSVRHALVAVGYEVIESTPKSHNARVVDLDAETVTQLRRYRRAQQEERKLWGAGYEDNGLVVAKENGEPIHPHTFSQSFERIITNAGLRKIRLHDLRHTHASLALKAGVPVKVVSERLGHESPAFTLKQYAHVIPGMQAEAAAQVAALVAPAPTS